MASPRVDVPFHREAQSCADEINRKITLLRERFAASRPFNVQEAKPDLESLLAGLKGLLVLQTQSALLQLGEWDSALVSMDTELAELEGLLLRAKANTASSLVASWLAHEAVVAPPLAPPAPVPGQLFQFPTTPFEIHALALEKVGHQPDDIERVQGRLRPLITEIPAGSPPPRFWSTPTDFFAPATSEWLRANDASYATSFSTFFGFNPVPALVKEQKALARQSMGKGFK
jgi:hypothetical protein